MIVPSIMHMRLVHETSLSCGKPPRRPPDPYLVGYVSHHDAPFIDLGVMGALGGHDTTLRVLGRIKEEGDILPTSSLPTVTSNIALRKEQQRADSSPPVCDFGIGDVK